ncbi:MAG: hypothetical protein GYA21_14125 [Myxococcales bacterium]|nr:hypothetical protein [Myxococcales bacterium]
MRNRVAFVPRVAGALLIVAAVGFGAACGPGPADCPEAPAAWVRPLFRTDPGAVTAFPADSFTVAADTFTGRRLQLPAEGTPVVAPGLPILMSAERMIAALDMLDGFSPFAPILVPLSGPIDPASLPQTAAASLETESPVFLMSLSPDLPQRWPVLARYLHFLDGREPEHVLVVQPARPLRDGTLHALVITDAVRGADGTPLGPTPESALLCGRCGAAPDPGHPLSEHYRRLRPLFSGEGALDPDRVALVLPVTTQSIAAPFGLLRQAATAPVLPASFDDDGDGVADLYDLASLPRSKSGFPLSEAIGAVARVHIASASFRDAEGLIRRDAQGVPQAVGTEELVVLLVFPAQARRQPFPLAILQHGHGADKENTLTLAAHLAARGVASVALDLPEHGERPRSGKGFLDLSNLPTVVANVEQTAADHFRLVAALRSLTALDVFPGGAGDGAPDLDPTRIAYAGQSLGALVAPIMVSREEVDPLVLNVGGGGFANLLDLYVGGLLSPRELLALGLLGQTLLDRADPVHHLLPFQSAGAPPAGRQVLLQEVIDDDTMPNPATETLARLIGVPLLRPVLRSVEGLPIADPPALHQGLVQFGGINHGFLFDVGAPGSAPYAGCEQIATFFETAFAGGAARIEAAFP